MSLERRKSDYKIGNKTFDGLSPIKIRTINPEENDFSFEIDAGTPYDAYK